MRVDDGLRRLIALLVSRKPRRHRQSKENNGEGQTYAEDDAEHAAVHWQVPFLPEWAKRFHLAPVSVVIPVDPLPFDEFFAFGMGQFLQRDSGKLVHLLPPASVPDRPSPPEAFRTSAPLVVCAINTGWV